MNDGTLGCGLLFKLPRGRLRRGFGTLSHASFTAKSEAFTSIHPDEEGYTTSPHKKKYTYPPKKIKSTQNLFEKNSNPLVKRDAATSTIKEVVEERPLRCRSSVLALVPLSYSPQHIENDEPTHHFSPLFVSFQIEKPPVLMAGI